ncbi:MAG: polysaccharide biosynthesis tyrosine autokinase [Aphanocapsa sp. GSE-SYN-MK-11-07L]|jgi:capsular exopolysaccharide synthesis family protein|nr:polysaccharide biosynthesis tyrosine autokinase [Aphanocapsa sp. GSE-SYN-MK-11-07L]
MSSELPSEFSHSSPTAETEFHSVMPVGNYRAYDRGTVGLKEILALIRRRAVLIAGVAGVVFAATCIYTFTRKPIYATGFEMLVTPIQTNPELKQGKGADEASPDYTGSFGAGDHRTLVQVLQTQVILAPAVKALQKNYPGIDAFEIAANLNIAQKKDTDFIGVSYSDTDPAKAFTVATQLAKSYVDYGDSLRKSSLTQGIEFVEKQLPSLQGRVSQLQAKLEKFRQRYSLIDPDARGVSLAEYISSIEQKQDETKAALDETQDTYANLRKQLGNYSPTEAIAASSLSTSKRYQALLDKLQEVETQIAQASVTYQPNSPQMQTLLETRQSLLPVLQQEAKKLLGNKSMPRSQGNVTGIAEELNAKMVQTANDLQMLKARSRALDAAQARLQQDFKLYPALARQHTDLQRQLKIATESLERFLETRENLEIESAQKSQPWQVLSRPLVPNLPVSPNVPRNLSLGFIGALLLGTAAAFLAEKLHDVFHSANDLRRDVMLPLLGIVPFRRELQTASQLEGQRLAEDLAASPDFVEAFRSVYSNIRLLSAGTPIRSVVITSALPADGKSTVACNLALAAAAMGKRVLLVDADLRRPTVHQNCDVSNLRGVTNVLTANVPFDQVIQKSTIEENLDILTAGQVPPDPTRLLASTKMQQLMKDLEAHYDLIVYDSPPLVGFADSMMLAGSTDGCLMVVGLGHTERSALLEALEHLKVSGTTVLGLVANSMKQYTSDENGFSKRYYARYYGDRVVEEAETNHLSSSS